MHALMHDCSELHSFTHWCAQLGESVHSLAAIHPSIQPYTHVHIYFYFYVEVDNEKLYVFGRSLGGAVALSLAHALPYKIRVCICVFVR